MNKLKDKCAHSDLISTYCEEVLSKVKREINAMQRNAIFFSISLHLCATLGKLDWTELESEWIFISVLAKTLDWPSD